MSQLLIQGSAILAQGPFTQDADNIAASDAVYPKHVVAGWQIVDAALPDGFHCADYTWNGKAVVAKPPAVVIPTVDEYASAVQSLLDTTAKAHNYDDIVSACSYAGAPNPFQAEGAAFVGWRGNVWAKCYDIMGAVQAGTRTPPTIAGLLAELPAFV